MKTTFRRSALASALALALSQAYAAPVDLRSAVPSQRPDIDTIAVAATMPDLLILRDYLSAVLDYVGKKIAAGEPKEKIVALENLPGFPDFHLPLPNRLGGNLATAYDELTDKKA